MKGKGNTEQITPADGEYLLWFSSYLVAPPLSFSVTLFRLVIFIAILNPNLRICRWRPLPEHFVFSLIKLAYSHEKDAG